MSEECSAVEIVGELERELPVDEIVFGDVLVWPLLRLLVGRAVDQRQSPNVSVAADGSVPRNLRRTLPRLRPPPARAAVDAVVLSHLGGRHLTVGGRGYDVFADPLVELAGRDGRRVEVWDAAYLDDARPAFGSPHPVDLLLGLAELTSRRPRGTTAAARAIGEAVDVVARRANELGAPVPARNMLRKVALVDTLASSFARLLERRRPRAAFVLCFYNTAGMAFDVACARAGVPAVDLQHGVQGAHHLNYGAVARPGVLASTIYPTRFWNWTAADAAWIDEQFGPGRAVVGGNLLEAVLADPASTLSRALAASPEDPPPAEREVLVSLQPGRGIPAVVADAIAAAPDGWRWWLRPHPSTDRAAIVAAAAALPTDRVEIERAATGALPLLLGRVHAHVTEWSSVVLEAERAGVPSVLVDARGDDLFAAQLASGRAARARTGAELVEAVAAATGWTPARPATAVAVDALRDLLAGPAR